MDEDQTSDEQEQDDYDNRNDVIVKMEPVVEYVQAKSLPPLKNSKRLKRTIRRKVFRDPNPAPTSTNTNQIDSKLLEMLRLLRKSSEISKKKDECDSFGEYIAVSLRKHDERTQSMIKQAINNILFEQEMKKYSAGQYVVISDENPLVLGESETVTS